MDLAFRWQHREFLPTKIELEPTGPNTSRNIDTGVAIRLDFLSPYRSGVMYEDASLLAVYDNNKKIVIPLQFYSEMSSISVPLPRTRDINCNYRTVMNELGSESSSVTIRFERYISAQILGRRIADENCRSGMRRAAVRVWFDRSYEIATRHEFIDLDREAIAQARAVGLGDYINPYLLDYNYLEVSRMLNNARTLRGRDPEKALGYYNYVIAEIGRSRSFARLWSDEARRSPSGRNQIADIRRERSSHERRMEAARREAEREATVEAAASATVDW